MSNDYSTVIPHIDEIDTTHSGWAEGIEKLRKDGEVYRIKTATHSGDIYLVKMYDRG